MMKGVMGQQNTCSYLTETGVRVCVCMHIYYQESTVTYGLLIHNHCSLIVFVTYAHSIFPILEMTNSHTHTPASRKQSVVLVSVYITCTVLWVQRSQGKGVIVYTYQTSSKLTSLTSCLHLSLSRVNLIICLYS